MKTRKIFGAIFSLLIILSIALSIVPFVVEEGYGVECGHPGSCPWAPSNPQYGKIAGSECCCKFGNPDLIVC